MLFNAGGAFIEIDDDLDEKVAEMPEVGDSAFEVAQKLAEIARNTAPVVSGDYAASIVAEKTKTGARVFSSDPIAAHVEFGVPTQGQPAHWTFRKAVDAAGLSFVKRGH